MVRLEREARSVVVRRERVNEVVMFGRGRAVSRGHGWGRVPLQRKRPAWRRVGEGRRQSLAEMRAVGEPRVVQDEGGKAGGGGGWKSSWMAGTRRILTRGWEGWPGGGPGRG